MSEAFDIANDMICKEMEEIMFDHEMFAHEVRLSPKENYFRMLDGKDFEYMPAFFNNGNAIWVEDLLTPCTAPDGPIVTTLGVTYVGCPEMAYGAMPKPGELVVDDIAKCRDQLHITDLSDFDFRDYYEKKMAPIDRKNNYVTVGGADYYLSLVSLMGFENTLLALYEEPELVHELLEELNRFYMLIFKKQLKYINPEMLTTMDDICSSSAPFFSLDMYHECFKPFEETHYAIARERGMHIGHHCCGKCEIFIPDWVEMGVQTWNPAQPVNDFNTIRKDFPDLTIEGGWDNVLYDTEDDEEVLRKAVRAYIDKFAPGGHFGFFAATGGDPATDPAAKRRADIVKDEYFKYGFDYYA